MTETALSPATLRRDRARGIAGGVCAGIAERLGLDTVLVRVALVVAVVATAGVALAGYALAWLLIPAGPAPSPSEVAGSERAPRALGRRRGGGRVAAGAGLLMLSGLLVFRELGVWWSDALIWPLVLATAGAALLWRQSKAMQPEAPSAPASLLSAPPTPAPVRPRRAGLADLYRGGFGIALVVGAGLLFLSANGALGATRDVVFATVVAVTALGLILAPFLWRLGRTLAAERAERIRSQERAELAAHLHDSVLQTLTLMQKRASDPREVASLARRQERELRSWLFDVDGRRETTTLAAALDAAAAEVEDSHGIVIDVVAVGDRPLDSASEALVAATREALTNAAKFASEAGPVAVYAEIEADRAQVFVRDRGAGFIMADVPGDRRGLRESVIGRMRRHGGNAIVRSTPGAGTEIELAIETEAPA